ncbi:MAG: response regulator [Alphaproteobacteria bacterium]
MSNKGKILVVEDNDFVRMQLCKFIEDDGFGIVEAKNGEEALVAINDDIALAIVDVRMEPLGGFEFVRTIRGDENKTPIIIVTGDDNHDLLSEASRLGIGAVLRKPVQKERLIKIISRTLEIERR